MQTSHLVESLQADLASLGSVGDDATARVASRVAAALGPSLRVRILEAVTEAASELSPQLPQGRVEVRLQGGEPLLIYVEDPPSRPASVDEAAEARITLRLPESLKARVEAAAGREGVSVNTWLVQAIVRNLEARAHRVGSRFTGYARS